MKKILLILLCLGGCNKTMPEGSKCIDNHVYYQATKDIWVLYNDVGNTVWCASAASAAGK